MHITIIGGGNIGMQFAIHSANKGHNVVIYTTQASHFSTNLKIVDKNNNVLISSKIKLVTDNIEQALKNANIVFITYPSFMLPELAEKIYPYVNNNTYIGLIPGIGGGEFAFRNFLSKNCVIFGIQRVPSVARIVAKGEIVCCSGYRNELFCASIIANETLTCCNILNEIFDMKVQPLPNFLNVSLTPSNPILHTVRLYSIFKDYKPGTKYKNIPLFYEEWNDESSELLFNCDLEWQNICKAISKNQNLDLYYLKSLKLHYESNNVNELTKKITSIESLKGLKTPCIKLNDNTYIPDFESRYFTADFPYGLNILIQIANLFQINVPNMNLIMNWYKNLQNKKKFSLNEYGIKTQQEFIEFYKM